MRKQLVSRRVRQIRVKNQSCKIDPAFASHFNTCLGAWSKDTDATNDYYGHATPRQNLTRALGLPTRWQHGSRMPSESTGAYRSTWGEYLGTVYDSPGYAQDLPADNYTQARALLQNLKDMRWIDTQTQPFTFEFTVCRPGVDRVITNVWSVEFPPTGGLTEAFRGIKTQSYKAHRYEGEDAWVLIMCEGLVLLYALHCMFVASRILRGARQRRDRSGHGIAGTNIYNDVRHLCTAVFRV